MLSNTDVGCKYGLLRMNVLAYADDIVLVADSLDHLDQLYGILDEGVKALNLEINKNKSKCMICERPSKRNILTEVKLAGDTLEIVENYRYLGYQINSQLLDGSDVKQRHCDFNSRFNSVFRNFKSVSIETFLFLFNSYCLPDYGLNLWHFNNILKKQPFKCFETGFSNALKKISGAPVYASFHLTADKCNQLLLKHRVS